MYIGNMYVLRGKNKRFIVDVPNVSSHSIYWMSRDRMRASRNFMYLLFLCFFRGTQARSAFLSCAVFRHEVESKNANLIAGEVKGEHAQRIDNGNSMKNNTRFPKKK